MQVSIAVNDFSPLARGLEPLFRGLKEVGADGVELGIGFKSRWTPRHCLKLSQKYALPITSVHQPMWSVMGLAFDEGAFGVAQQLDVRTVTCHPLPKLSYDDPKMKQYFECLARLKQKTGLEILIENLPEKYNHPVLNKFFPPGKKAMGIVDLYRATQEFGLDMTLDTDHLQSARPHAEPYFETLLPSIKNVHLSSFRKGAHHLPLFLGSMQSKEFVDYLAKVGYGGLLTLEIGHPSITLFNYNFDTIKKSIEIIKNNTG